MLEVHGDWCAAKVHRGFTHSIWKVNKVGEWVDKHETFD
jgi:hypothetical protein